MGEQLRKTGTVLVIGATGYVGSRLVPMLLAQGVKVRAAGRSLEKLMTRVWATNPNVELRQLDLKDLESTKQAVEGCDAVYYLMHSMNPQNKDFAAADKVAAENMVKAGEQKGFLSSFTWADWEKTIPICLSICVRARKLRRF